MGRPRSSWSTTPGISPRGTVESTRRSTLGADPGNQLKGPWLGIKAALPLLRNATGNDHQHRLDARDPADARALLLHREQGRALGPDAAGRGRVSQRGDHLQHGRTRVGRHTQRANDPGRLRPAGFPAGIRNLTTPEEIGAAVVFLASPPGRKINGVILYLDAGLHIADDAGMVYLPERIRPPFEQRIEES